LVKKLGIKSGNHLGGFARDDHERRRFDTAVGFRHDAAIVRTDADVVLFKRNFAGLEVDAHQFAGEAPGLDKEQDASHFSRCIRCRM
jgi:hypothetical protein